MWIGPSRLNRRRPRRAPRVFARLKKPAAASGKNEPMPSGDRGAGTKTCPEAPSCGAKKPKIEDDPAGCIRRPTATEEGRIGHEFAPPLAGRGATEDAGGVLHAYEDLPGGVVRERRFVHPNARFVAGTSAENEGSKKVKKKKIKKKEDFCGFKMRFNSKRLGDLAQQLSPPKQGIIRNGLFGNLLDIKPFKVPHALIEFVVMHTNHALLEFKYKNKSIKFSKNMVKRIFNVPSSDSPMKLLKKSDEHDLRSIYKEGNRAPIAHVFKLLRDCSDMDEAMIRRTWSLVALAIVVCPDTGNMVNLEYLPSLENMDLVHNLA
ncbi:Cytokinin-O-glucosyltransferase 2 [Hordeum vulgare]|nr:Cytokinin-O-glucosyltransferase 2 [Hordeum vulgare]